MIFIDQLKRTVQLSAFPPQRIISLVPSQTELLFDLGLDDEVIGITKFCVRPDKWFRTKKRIGGTKQINISGIKELSPDLIIANKEENLLEQVEELEKDFPVWTSDIRNVQDAYAMIESVGQLVNKIKSANQIVDSIRNKFKNLDAKTETRSHPRVAYLIWKDPLMTVGGDTFISDMMHHAGLDNIFQDRKRYPTTTFEELRSLDCELLLLSSEPFPFKQVHANEMKSELANTKIILIDGEMFSWYGSRLEHAPNYFTALRELVFNS